MTCTIMKMSSTATVLGEKKRDSYNSYSHLRNVLSGILFEEHSFQSLRNVLFSQSNEIFLRNSRVESFLYIAMTQLQPRTSKCFQLIFLSWLSLCEPCHPFSTSYYSCTYSHCNNVFDCLICSYHPYRVFLICFYSCFKFSIKCELM